LQIKSPKPDIQEVIPSSSSSQSNSGKLLEDKPPDELDFFELDDETELLDLAEDEGLDGSPPLRSEDDSAMELLVSFSGLTKLLLSSSPQATNSNVNASAKT
jgi:hypothetical protein